MRRPGDSMRATKNCVRPMPHKRKEPKGKGPKEKGPKEKGITRCLGRKVVVKIETKPKKTYGLELIRKKIPNLGRGKDRAIFTDIYVSDIASATLADTAFHLHLQSGEYLIVGKTELLQ